ncbi:MAG: hypothetical protein FWG36_02015 [Oscillospiraceae bacterium]|nr:hypothetical protein [Oscillospiraceae bacterium]
MFLPHKSDNGAVSPWEHYPAAAGTYKAGQLLNVNAGKVAAITAITAVTPPYLCMADTEIKGDELLPVTRVSGDLIYETTLKEDTPTAALGVKLRVANGGLHAQGGAAGTFEIVELEGTDEDDTVRGRFV